LSRIELFLFGLPYLKREGKTLEVDARKTMAILAYLAASDTPRGRDSLLALLWPNLEPRKAQNVLRRNLSTLNKTLDGQWLIVNRDMLSLDKEANAWVDVAHFRQLANRWLNHDHLQPSGSAEYLENLANAANLYRADFLAGFGVRNSPNFDEWQYYESEQLKRTQLALLNDLVDGHSQLGEIDKALAYARQSLTHDPLNEPIHRSMMQLYAQKGERAAALRHYQQCVQLLKQELDIQPEPETIALYERLRTETKSHPKSVAETYQIINGDTPAGRKKSWLGSGSMGTVFRGVNTLTGETVAIKVLRSELVESSQEVVERFVREGEILRKLNHPNIVKMLAASQQDGRYFLVMEYVTGGTLRDLITKTSLLTSEQTLQIALDIADALTRAHRLNIIHRDLKPANILIAEDGTPRLTDFGIARLKDTPQMTKTGQIMGTISYLSPEGLNGKPLNEQADIWAFGVVLYEMLTGEQPFKGETIQSTMAAILTQPMPQLHQLDTDIPTPLINLIERMLHKDPAQRISSVRLVGAELEAIIAKRPFSLPTPTKTGPPPHPPTAACMHFRK
jgi:DNA-binding SARP family transcriptional activator/predicted Ser/Thr protein kinase